MPAENHPSCKNEIRDCVSDLLFRLYRLKIVGLFLPLFLFVFNTGRSTVADFFPQKKVVSMFFLDSLVPYVANYMYLYVISYVCIFIIIYLLSCKVCTFRCCLWRFKP